MFDILGFMELMQDMFYIQQVKFSPTDLGIPAHRLRSYTLCVNKARVVTRILQQGVLAGEVLQEDGLHRRGLLPRPGVLRHGLPVFVGARGPW